jgi:predicted DNA-binding transcriptional regulator AlpA
MVRHLGMVRPQHGSTYRRSETTAMSDAVDRLAQALRDLINEVVQGAVERERTTPPAARGVERPQTADEEFDMCPSSDKKHTRRLMPVKEARYQLGGISPSTFYGLVNKGELSLVKIGSRSFVQAEELDDFVKRKRYEGFPGRT